jgi:hypothetical protein
MAKRSGLSRSTVGRIWKAFSLKPHLSATFKLSKDPLFIDYPANPASGSVNEFQAQDTRLGDAAHCDGHGALVVDEAGVLVIDA